MAKVCSSCGAPLEENDLFCMKCGTPVDQKKHDKKRYCPQCGNVLAPDAIFCDVCGRETEREKPKKKQEAEIGEPATMEGLLSPTITEDMFANSKELNKVKFDGFESVDESMLQKADEDKALKHKEKASFEMDSAALPEIKRREEPKAKAPEPPKKKEVTAESIKSSNPYGDYAAKAGGKTIQTAKGEGSAQPLPEAQPAAETEKPKSPGGLAGLIAKIKSIFTKK